MMINPQLWSRSGAGRTRLAALTSVNGSQACARTRISDGHAALSVIGQPDADGRQMRLRSALRPRRRWAP